MGITGREKILILSALKDAYENILENKEQYENPEEEAKEFLDLYNKLLKE
ncbi:MAG: hypothetical protein ABRQ25_00295 [Clostridiaceae bacterium]